MKSERGRRRGSIDRFIYTEKIGNMIPKEVQTA